MVEKAWQSRAAHILVAKKERKRENNLAYCLSLFSLFIPSGPYPMR
jgi:hypothetical protein